MEEKYLDKSILIYGGTGTGKTYIMKHIMNALKDDIENVYVFAPTNDENKSFSKIVPSIYIYNHVSEELLTNLIKIQKNRVKYKKKSEDYLLMESYFKKYMNDMDKKVYNNITKETTYNIKKGMGASEAHVNKERKRMLLYKKVFRKKKTETKRPDITQHYW